MPRLQCNPGPARWAGPRPGEFRPAGNLSRHGTARNPATWSSTDTLSGRLFVGFNVGAEPRWSVEDLIPIVLSVRERQTGDPSATFMTQRGIYKHHDPDAGVVVEDGAQVIIFHGGGPDDQEAFEDQLVELAEVIGAKLQQESVIVEVQRNGIAQRVMGVEPDESAKEPACTGTYPDNDECGDLGCPMHRGPKKNPGEPYVLTSGSREIGQYTTIAAARVAARKHLHLHDTVELARWRIIDGGRYGKDHEQMDVYEVWHMEDGRIVRSRE